MKNMVITKLQLVISFLKILQKIVNKKKAARVYGANEAVSLDDLIDAWEIGCKYYWECAEFLGFSPRYVVDAVQYIKEKYGPIFNYKGYQFRFTTETCMEITK